MSAGYLCKSVPLRGDILLGAGGVRNKARAREMARGYKAKGLGLGIKLGVKGKARTKGLGLGIMVTP